MTSRRAFLQTLGAGAIALANGNLRAQGAKPAPRKNFLWLRPSITRSPDDWRRDFDLWRASGISGLMAEVYNGRQALFHSTRLPVRSPWLETAIPIA